MTRFGILGAALVMTLGCAAEAERDASGEVESAIGWSGGGDSSFASLSYAEPGLATVHVRRTSFASTAGKGDFITYSLSAVGVLDDRLDCAITQTAVDELGDAVTLSSESTLTGTQSDDGTFAVGTQGFQRFTHRFYSSARVETVDFICGAPHAETPLFRVRCEEPETLTLQLACEKR